MTIRSIWRGSSSWRTWTIPILARFYQQGSFFLPNIGMDAIAVPLSGLLGPEPATRIFVDLTLLTPLFGTILLHRAAHGRFSAWPLLAVLFLHNGIFRFGFFNYLFGMGLALAAAALWMVLRPGLTRSAIGLMAAILLLLVPFRGLCGFRRGLRRGGDRARLGEPGAATAWARSAAHLTLAAPPFVICLALFALFRRQPR